MVDGDKHGGAGDVEHEPVGRVGRDERRVSQSPDREPLECGLVGGEIGLDHGDMRVHGLRDRDG